MLNFFKDSIRDLKHVVWPTKAETQKYFIVVVGMLVFFWLYLFMANTIFSEILFTTKNILSGWNINSTSWAAFDPNSITVGTWSTEESSSWTANSWTVIDDLSDESTWWVDEK